MIKEYQKYIQEFRSDPDNDELSGLTFDEWKAIKTSFAEQDGQGYSKDYHWGSEL